MDRDGVVRVWDLTGQLVKSFDVDWRPKNVKDAARLSGLMRKGLDVRFLTPDEEKDLRIDAAVPLEEESLAAYRRAELATTRNFKMLEDKRDLRPEEVKQGDLLEGWLSSHQQSSADKGNPGSGSRGMRIRYKFFFFFELFVSTFSHLVSSSGFGNYSVAAHADLFALRGFVCYLTATSRGAKEDHDSCLEATLKVNIGEWDVSLGQAELFSKKLYLGGEFLTWLQSRLLKWLSLSS